MQSRAGYIKKSLDACSSPKLFFGLSVLLAVHFYMAAPYYMNHKRMLGGLNSNLPLDWIARHSLEYPLVLGWIIIAALLFAVLGLNIFSRILVEFFALSRISRNVARAGRGGANVRLARKFFIFFIHISFFLMLGFYFVSSVTGYKFIGPIIKEGHVITSPKLPFNLECVSVNRKASKRMSKPEIVFRVLGEGGGETFSVPGWYRGTYYDVKGAVVPRISDQKGSGGFVFKLSAHRFNALVFSALLVVWLGSFFLFMFVRFGREKRLDTVAVSGSAGHAAGISPSSIHSGTRPPRG